MAAILSGLTDGVVDAIGFGLSIGTELLIGGVTLLVTVGGALLIRTLSNVPAFQTVFSWLSRLYWAGAIVFTGFELGIEFSRLRQSKGHWMLSIANVVLWPVMWGLRVFTADRMRQVIKAIQSGNDEFWTLDRLMHTDPCNWHQWLWIPNADVAGFDQLSDTFVCESLPPFISSITKCYEDNSIIKFHKNKVGPIWCYLRAQVHSFLNRGTTLLDSSDINKALQDEIKCGPTQDQ